MLRVKPFQGLRPVDDLVSLVVAPPFEAIASQEAAAQAADNPYSMLHVEHAEIDLPTGTASGSTEAIKQARQTFQTFREHEILVSENQPCVYLHQERVGEAAQIGIVLTCHIDDFRRGTIRSAPVGEDAQERQIQIIKAIAAQTTPVLLNYPDSPDLAALIAEVVKMPPLYDFATPDGVGHTVWRLPGLALGDFFVRAFEQVPFATVIDGHSLAASVCRVGRERREQNPDHTGEEPYNWLLCVLFPTGQDGAFEPQQCSGLFVHTFEEEVGN